MTPTVEGEDAMVSSSFLFPDPSVIGMLINSFSPRLLKKVQIQGAAPQAERGVLEVRRSECQGAATQ